MRKRIAKKIMCSDYYWVSVFNGKGGMFVAARSPKHLHLLDKAFCKFGDHEFIPIYRKDYELFCNGDDFAEALIKSKPKE